MKNFLLSIEKSISEKENLEVIVVDNGYPYKGDTRETIKLNNFPFKIKFVQNPETSYASGINRGYTRATNDIIIVANSDIELFPSFSTKFIFNEFNNDSKIGVIGPQLVYPNGSWQRSFGIFPCLKELLSSLLYIDFFSHAICKFLMTKNLLLKIRRRVDYVDGAFMITRRKCFEELHGFNEIYQFYGEDTDFCYRAKKLGWKIIFLPNVHIKHLRGASSTQKSYVRYSTTQFKAKFQFIRENFGIRYEKYYKELTKAVILQRIFTYAFLNKFIPFSSLVYRKRHAILRYIVLKSSP